MLFINKLNNFLKKENFRGTDSLEYLLYQVGKDPGKARSHLKLAEGYQKKGEKKRAISEYLLAAEIFAKNNQYAEAMAIYKQVPKQDPSLDHVYLKIADIYRKMGFLGDAFAQYRILVNHYDKLGRQDKAMEIMGLMSELDLRNLDLDEGIQNFGDLFKEEEAENISYEQKEGCEEGVFKKVESGSFFDLNAELQTGTPIDLGGLKEVSTSEKPYGAQDLLKDLEKVNDSNFVYPDFHYQLGEAYLEMGSFDAAGEQFQLALENGQRPFEAAFMLGLLFKKENKWNEACRAFEKALDVKGIAEERKQEAKAELTLFGKELGKNK